MPTLVYAAFQVLSSSLSKNSVSGRMYQRFLETHCFHGLPAVEATQLVHDWLNG